MSFFSSRFLYPVIVTLLISTVTFPKGPGMLVAGEVREMILQHEIYVFNSITNYSIIWSLFNLIHAVSWKKYCSSQLTQKKAIEELFSNTTWSLGETEDSDVPAATLKHWNGAFGNIYVTLVFFIIIKVTNTANKLLCS